MQIFSEMIKKPPPTYPEKMNGPQGDVPGFNILIVSSREDDSAPLLGLQLLVK